MKQSDRDKLCELHADMKWVKLTLGNHLKHHQNYEVALVIGFILVIIEQLIVHLLG